MPTINLYLAFCHLFTPPCAVVIEQRHGFNKQTKALFFTDLVKTMLLGLVLLPPLVGGFTWLLQRAGPWVPLQLWAFFFTVAVVMMTIYPTCKHCVGAAAIAQFKHCQRRKQHTRLSSRQFIHNSAARCNPRQTKLTRVCCALIHLLQ